MTSKKNIIKIGVFDSGVGGKLIAAKIQQALPGVEVIFKSDPEYFPYGNKSAKTILGRVSGFVGKFQKLGCQIIVIACNSATTNIIDSLRKRFPQIKFVGVEPPLKPIVKMTKAGKVAILGTRATIQSSRLKDLVKRYAGGTEVSLIACPGLAEYIERLKSEDMEVSDLAERSRVSEILRKFLDKPIASGADVVGIACTHYPYLLPTMRELYPGVIFYDPADAVVAHLTYIMGV